MTRGLLIATLLGTAVQAAAQPTPIRTIQSPVRLELQQALVIGEMDGPAAFGRIMDVKLGRRGRVYVADDLRHAVFVFDSVGRFVRSVGRRGNGPGEFQAPWRIALDASDSLFVWDVSLARVSVYAPDLSHARDFRLPPHWLVNTMAFQPDGTLLVSAYGAGEAGVLHVVSRDGSVRRTFGPRPPAGEYGGFESSLLGGYAALDGGRVAYSNKSPYELVVLDRASGRILTHCTGDREWTTPPAAAVHQTARASSLRMSEFVHSAGVFALGGGRYLNLVFDPVRNRATVDLLTDRCILERRTSLPGNLVFSDLAGSRLAASRELDYPEVVIYRVRVTGASAQPGRSTPPPGRRQR
jgi:6-bladed beta-propeller